jgi:hypothetical protein
MYWKESEMSIKETETKVHFYEVTIQIGLDKELVESDDVEINGIQELMSEIQEKTEDYLESLGISVIESSSCGNKLEEPTSDNWFYDVSQSNPMPKKL